MNIVMLALSMSVFMYLHTADRHAMSYNDARALSPLTQPLPPYPWDESTADQFVEHYDPSCCCSDSPKLPIPESLPCSFNQCNFNVLTRLQNNGCTATTCCQTTSGLSGITLVADLSAICCSGGSISTGAGFFAAGCGLVSSLLLVGTGLASICSLSTDNGNVPLTVKFDRDYMRSAIAFYSMHARLAQERQPLCTTPVVPVMHELRDAVDEQS